MEYCEAIKVLRRKMALTQEEFGRLLNASAKSVNRWENGKFEPTIKIKKKLLPLFKENQIEVR